MQTTFVKAKGSGMIRYARIQSEAYEIRLVPTCVAIASRSVIEMPNIGFMTRKRSPVRSTVKEDGLSTPPVPQAAG